MKIYIMIIVYKLAFIHCVIFGKRYKLQLVY